MQAKTLTGLFVATAVAVAVAAATTWSQPGSANFDRRGEVVFPDLAAGANQLTALKLDAGDWQAQLRREGDGFVDASGFPVKVEPIRAIITGLSTLTYEEPKTRDPERYADLELADPSPDTDAGRQVSLYNGDTVLASLIVGERDLTVGGMRGGIFARQPDDPQSWLLRGTVSLPGSRADLFETQLLDWNTDDVAALTVADSDQSVQLASAGAGEPLTAGATENAALDAEKILALGAVVNNLRFADVRKAKPDAVVAGSLQYRLRNGAVVTIERLAQGAEDADQRWLRLQPSLDENADDAARELIAPLSEKVGGLDFQLNETAWETLARGPADLVKKGDD